MSKIKNIIAGISLAVGLLFASGAMASASSAPSVSVAKPAVIHPNSTKNPICAGAFFVIIGSPYDFAIFYQQCAMEVVGTGLNVSGVQWQTQVGNQQIRTCGHDLFTISANLPHGVVQTYSAPGREFCSNPYIPYVNPNTGTINMNKTLKADGEWYLSFIPDAGYPGLPEVSGSVHS